MNAPVTDTKLVELLQIEFQKETKILDYLQQGDLYNFEQLLKSKFDDLFNKSVEILLQASALEQQEFLRARYKTAGLSKFKLRPMLIELHTGYRVEVKSLYAKKVEKSVEGSRHTLERYWSIIGHCSPFRLSQVGICAAISPSYDVGNELLMNFSAHQSTSRVRKITGALADYCFDKDESLCLSQEETLTGKRVVLSIDGGRTRTKSYKPSEGKNLRSTSYETPWCEPKLFVIQVLDEEGEIAKGNLPIYGTRFSEEDVINLLKCFLIKLNIEQAKEVQIVADGAGWIWNRLKPMLLELGVNEAQIIETIDHPHASEYVHKIIQQLPTRVGKKKINALLNQFKTWLWEGNALKIVAECRLLFRKPTQELNRWINYLEKHEKKMQYAHYQELKWMCGSGIVESGIRRIINLRFKNPSTFWYKQNVEKLFFLRSTCLSKRWGILMHNIANFEFK
jgi:hypothetical protein